MCTNLNGRKTAINWCKYRVCLKPTTVLLKIKQIQRWCSIFCTHFPHNSQSISINVMHVSVSWHGIQHWFSTVNEVQSTSLLAPCIGWSRKTTQSLMHHHLATVRCRITQLAPKCLAMITVYQSMQNWVSVLSKLRRNWIHINSDVTLHVNITPPTSQDRLLIKTLQTEKATLLT